MRNNKYLLNLIDKYQSIYNNEDIQISSLLLNQLKNNKNIFSRKNFIGHITCSALILNKTQDKILLINHKFLKMWLHPGGHVEGINELYKEAIREVLEETSLIASLHTSYPKNDIPFSIDSYKIPISIEKNEPSHIHHDFTYLFTGDSTQKLIKQIKEIKEIKWFTLLKINNIKTDANKFINRIKKYIF